MFKFRQTSAITKLQELAADLEESADELRGIALMLGKGNPAARVLIAAIAEPLLAEGALFPKRLAQDAQIVHHLTHCYAKQLSSTGQSLFFESGTTPAWLAINLLELGKTDFSHVVTNNRAVSDVLCSCCRVWETEGWADTKYYGLYPFTSDGSDIDRDAINLQRLHRALSTRVDRLVLDASYFSFLLGPTVNSWQNVCYKVSAYNVNRPIDLLLPYRKIIMEVGTADRVDSKNFVNTLCWHLTNCYTVFVLPRLEHLGRIHPDTRHLKKKGAGISHFLDTAQLTRMQPTWLELAASNEDLAIWIGCPDADASFALKEYLRELNRELVGSHCSVQWTVDREEVDGSIPVIVVRPKLQP